VIASCLENGGIRLFVFINVISVFWLSCFLACFLDEFGYLDGAFRMEVAVKTLENIDFIY
jgi:hypothetical protein